MKTIIRLLCAVCLGSLLAACGQSDAEQAAQQQRPPPEVVVTEAELATVPLTLNFTGNAQALRSVEIRSQVNGFLDQQLFTEGERINAGDRLYQIDPRPFRAALNQSQADLAAEQANLNYLEKRANRFRELRRENAVSRDELDEIVAQTEQSRSRIQSLRAAVARAELDLEFTTVSAPFAGRMEQSQVDEGDLIIARTTVMTQLIQLDPIHVSFEVSRAQGYRIQKMQQRGAISGDTESYTVEAIGLDGEPYPQQGKLDFVSADIDPLTDTFVARALLPNPNTSLIPGQYVRVKVYLGEQPDQVLIPEQALAQGQGGYFVYLVGDDNAIKRQPVTPGSIYQGRQVIEQGLSGGGRIAVEGLQQIRPGMTVKPLTQRDTQQAQDDKTGSARG